MFHKLSFLKPIYHSLPTILSILFLVLKVLVLIFGFRLFWFTITNSFYNKSTGDFEGKNDLENNFGTETFPVKVTPEDRPNTVICEDFHKGIIPSSFTSIPSDFLRFF